MTGVNTRPCICPDLDCKMLVSTFDSQLFKQGYSFHCIGVLPEAHSVQWRSVQHINGHCLCIYTPLKGLLKFLMTIGDFEILNSSLGKVISDEWVAEYSS